MYWNSDDANDYLQAIKSTLSEFLPEDIKNDTTDSLTENSTEE